uniref:Mab-21-like nucleotidyltransferase domain-containing protein n=1 Tax=Clytia hemisphaerica TaxID=252671 RepID=A0A7M5V3Z5_9CNID|eukprot:TCONS_00051705-protein
MEWDIEYEVLKGDPKDISLSEMTNRPGYVRPRIYGFGSSGKEFRENLLARLKDFMEANKPMVKKEFYDIIHGDTDDCEDHWTANEQRFPWLGIETNVKADGLSIVVEILDNTGGIHFSCDNIVTIRCIGYWPPSAKEWGLGPGFESLNLGGEIEKIKENGCSIVPKPETETSDLSWRISLSDAESRIVKSFDKQQKLAYFIAKIIYYKHLSHLKDGNSELSSFAIKNATFNYFRMPSATQQTISLSDSLQDRKSSLFLDNDNKEFLSKQKPVPTKCVKDDLSWVRETTESAKFKSGHKMTCQSHPDSSTESITNRKFKDLVQFHQKQTHHQSLYAKHEKTKTKTNLQEAMTLIRGLLEYLKDSYTPKLKHERRPYMNHHFIEGVNVLSHVTPELGNKAVQVLQKILAGNIIDDLPSIEEIESVISLITDTEVRINNKIFEIDRRLCHR